MEHSENISDGLPVSSALTKRRLMEAGTEEFFRTSYKEASLRRICRRCGVTTGAFYFSFSSKQDLFCAIVDPVIQKLTALSETMVRQELDDPSYGLDANRKIMEFELQYRRELIILMEKSEGSGRESVKEMMFDRLLSYFTLFFARELGRQPDPDIMRLLAGIRMEANLSLLKGNHDMEKILLLNDVVGCYADGGFDYLIHNFKDRL